MSIFKRNLRFLQIVISTSSREQLKRRIENVLRYSCSSRGTWPPLHAMISLTYFPASSVFPSDRERWPTAPDNRNRTAYSEWSSPLLYLLRVRRFEPNLLVTPRILLLRLCSYNFCVELRISYFSYCYVMGFDVTLYASKNHATEKNKKKIRWVFTS